MLNAFPPPADAQAAARFMADFAARVPDAPDTLRPLLACLGGNSPFLADLALREPENLLRIAANGADALCDAALGEVANLSPGLPRGDVAAALRRAKRAVALAASVADIGGAWQLHQVTGVLSDLADGALRLCVAHLLRAAHQAGRINLPHPGAPSRGCGFTVLAMGKLGARELNFSSDVDLILLYDPAVHPGRDDLGQTMARLARDLVGLMATRDAGGYVFRVDLRLRPDPGSTPLAVSVPAALTYYESLGQTWERAALIKARPVAGDIVLGRHFLDEVRPFVWRRFLDFAAIADLRAMKQRMDAHKGTALGHGTPPEQLLSHDVKLGEGGIREVEFCAQVLQLVWGGRTPAVRVPPTLEALAAEVAAGYLAADTQVALSAAYVFLRGVEHRLQMVADRQTHALPSTMPELERFACFLSYEDAGAFAEVALGHMNAVHAVFNDLFAMLPGEQKLPVAGVDKREAETVAAWLAGKPRAFRTERTKALLLGLLPAIQAGMARQPDPAAALTRLDEFFHRLPAGVQVLSMLHHNPALLDRLADVLGAAPWLADHLAEVPAALEGLAGSDETPDTTARLGSLLQDARGIDDALSIASSMVRAAEFSIAAGELFGRIDADEAGRRRTKVADAVIGECLERVLADHARRYGRVRGGGLAVVALGKAGSGEMMAGSDLDLMLIYDHPPEAESTGPKTLPASQYYARAAQAVIGALTVPTRHGPLYQVDMRLRPSGSSGPVAVSLASFVHYHRESAWTWERLALTRARVVAGPARLRARVEAAIGAALRGADPRRVLADTVDMRARLLRDLPPHGVWDAKLLVGGLMETEFIAQALTLLHPRRGALGQSTAAAFAALARDGALAQAEADALIGADRFWRTVQGLMRIALGRQIPSSLPAPLLEKLLRATGAGDCEASLRTRADLVAKQVHAAFVRHVGGS